MATVLTGDGISELLNVLLDNGCYLRNSYSGRGMYGARCFGFDYDEPSQLAKVGVQLYSDEAKELWGELMDNASYDSMGLGSVIYFPGYIVDSELFPRFVDV